MADQTELDEFIAQHRAFLGFLLDWRGSLQPISLGKLVESAGAPDRVAIACVDLIKGFTTQGPLASPRVAAIVPAVAALFEKAHAAGVRDFVLLQDAHPADSLEFESYGPHCAVGSPESETVDELARLPFASEFTILPKETVSAAVGTGLDDWVDEHPDTRAFIVVGDCTDICVYQLAMHLRTRSIADKRRREVIVPEDCVQTYDLAPAASPGGTAEVMPHDGDLLHLVFLYHMALNGIRVVSAVR
ncbi:MAG: cysteine hydrolase family protein [Armatimonadota bacterium]